MTSAIGSRSRPVSVVESTRSTIILCPRRARSGPNLWSTTSMTSDSVGSGNCWWADIVSPPDRALSPSGIANGEMEQDGVGENNWSFDGNGLQTEGLVPLEELPQSRRIADSGETLSAAERP